MSLSGRWEGKLVDVSGVAAGVVLDLKDSRGELSGDFSISLVPPPDDPCASPDRRQLQSGPVSGKVDGDRVSLTYTVTVQLQPIVVTLDATVVKADPHARRAMMGCFDIQKGGELLTMEGGGCVLWQYATGVRATPGRRSRRAG